MTFRQAAADKFMQHVSLGALALAIIAIPSVARAQSTGEDQGLTDIVVTAQKREQNLQDVGVAVSAISADDLEAMGVADAKDIARVMPGVVFDATASGSVNANLTVRGVSQSDFSSTQESPNSIYIDEVYLSSPNAAAFPLYDLERIEVLRGPQGTLFGRASSGGLASFITKKPSNQFEGYAEVGYSRFNTYYAEAGFGGPISDSVRYRLSGKTEHGNGWFRNTNPGGKDTFEKKFYGIRGQIEADLSDALTARLSVSYDKSPRHLEGLYKPINFYVDPATGDPTPLPATLDFYGTGPGNDFAGYRDTNPDAQTGSFNNVGFLSNERFSPTLNLQWDAGSATVTSITNYTKFKYAYNEDCDGGPVDFCNFPLGQDLDQWTQELRVNGKAGALTYTAGLYYLNIKQVAFAAFSFPALSGSDFAFSDTNPVGQKAESYAAFGQLEYEFTEQLKATFGLRYTHDKKTVDSKVFFYELGNGYSGGIGTTIFDPPLLVYDFSPATVGALATAKANLWSGKFQLDYKPSDDALIYASVSRGAKGPGFNTNVSGNLTAAETPFGSESLWAYEVGSKFDLLDRRLRFNSSVFYYDYSNFQGFAFNGLQGVVGNYDGYFYGGEVELVAKIGSGLTANLGAAYLKSKLRDIPTARDGVIDQESILAPRWTVNGAVNKKFDIGANNLNINWSFDYVDDRFASIDNNAATAVKGSFVHNVRVSFEFESAGVELAAFINNISDIDRENFSYDLLSSTGSVIKSYAKPRWWGFSVRKTF
jgi:iron complex outermembrane recepter protein